MLRWGQGNLGLGNPVELLQAAFGKRGLSGKKNGDTSSVPRQQSEDSRERGITEKSYLIEINKISDHWLQKYFSKKAAMLREAMETKELPPICTPRERWNDRKCLDYCAARENCPYARRLIAEKENNTESVSSSESQAG